jgi:hypothetical protein
MEVFGVVTTYNVAVGYEGFGGPCCLFLHFTVKMEAESFFTTVNT